MAQAPTGGVPTIGFWQALQNLVSAVTTISNTLGKVFPLATGTAATATGGAATLPGAPVGFIEVYVPSLAATVKVPYYNT